MNKKREYPLFLIDRSRLADYDNDYIVCLDREAGFVAKILFFPKDDVFREFVGAFNNMENSELAGVFMQLKKGGIVLQVVDFLYYFEVNTRIKNRVQVLLKKALKKYLHGVVDRTPKKDLGVENQIKQQQLTLERAIQNYDELVERSNGDKSIADYQIDLARETLRTLKRYKDMQGFFESGFNLNFNPDNEIN